MVYSKRKEFSPKRRREDPFSEGKQKDLAVVSPETVCILFKSTRRSTSALQESFKSLTSRKHAYIFLTPQTPLLYSKTGVYRGIHYFSYICSKHRLWVLVRTASPRRFYRVPTIYVLSKSMKNIRVFDLKIFNFLEMKVSIYLNRHVFVMVVLILHSILFLLPTIFALISLRGFRRHEN